MKPSQSPLIYLRVDKKFCGLIRATIKELEAWSGRSSEVLPRLRRLADWIEAEKTRAARLREGGTITWPAGEEGQP